MNLIVSLGYKNVCKVYFLIFYKGLDSGFRYLSDENLFIDLFRFFIQFKQIYFYCEYDWDIDSLYSDIFLMSLFGGDFNYEVYNDDFDLVDVFI